LQFEIAEYAHVHIIVGPPASTEGGARFEPGPDRLITLRGTPAQPPQRRHFGRLLLKSGLAVVVLLTFSFAKAMATANQNGSARLIRPFPRPSGRIDRALGGKEETAYLLKQNSHPIMAEVTAFMTGNCRAVLAAQVIVEGTQDPYLLTRTATGDETMDLLCTDEDAEPESADQTML
jgi:hypothetical protein